MSDNRNIDALERNGQRAACAEAAVKAYASAKAGNTTDVYDFDSEDAQERLIDLLADLRHWADQGGLDFDDAVRIAAGHFEAEKDEEDETDVQEGGAQ